MKRTLVFALSILVGMVSFAQKPTYDEIRAMSPSDGLGYALEMYELYEPHIVMAQAVLETGWYKSELSVKHGNLFGIYDSVNKCYKHYDHWIESVKDYRDLVQSKYNGGDYFEFLERIGYASDPDYIKKVKTISEQFIDYE